MVVRSHAVVNPWAMAVTLLSHQFMISGRHNLLIKFCDASLAPPTMLAANGLPDHALSAEIIIVKLPKREKLFNDTLLLTPASCLGYIAWVLDHAQNVKVAAYYQQKQKGDIHEWMMRVGFYV